MTRFANGQVDKVINIIATSSTSWEEAARVAVGEAAKTIFDLHGARVVERDMLVRDGEYQYRVKLEMAFQLDRNRIDAGGIRISVKRYLIVANHTLASPGLRQLVEMRMARSPSEFHVLVPQGLTPVLHTNPTGYFDAALHETVAEARSIARADAEERLESFREQFRDNGVPMTGEVAVGDPVLATRRVMERSSFDEIIVSTLPPGISRWLKLDLANRLERAFNVPVTSLVQRDEVTA